MKSVSVLSLWAFTALFSSHIYAQNTSSIGTKSNTAARPQIPVFAKPVYMFDNSTAILTAPAQEIVPLVMKLRDERGNIEEMVSLKDKKGLKRIAFLEHGNTQSVCSQYADMYFDAKNKWLSTEEFFSVKNGANKSIDALLAKFITALEGKGYRLGICEEGGNPSFWKISTPALVWYECEVFKKSVENNSLSLKIDKEPFNIPNAEIYGTAYFDASGNFVRLQAKSKVKLSAN